jgi:AraC family transcriptional regulator
MASSTLTAIDFTQESSLTHPSPPILSSRGTNWERLHLSLRPMPPLSVPEHYTTHHSICVHLGSRLKMQMTVDSQSKTVDLIPSAIGIYPANVWQAFEWHQETAFLDLFLEPSLITQAGIEHCGKDNIELVPILGSCSDPLIYQIAIALKAALEMDRSGSKLYADTMGNALAVHLVSRYSTRQAVTKQYAGGLSEQNLKQVTDYIHANLEQDLSLAELANLVQLSPYHFARLFKRSTGFAPHRYHIKCRVERAQQLLLAGDLGLAEIACVVGFASQGHLNYHFKRWVGATPTAFLQQQ